MVWFMNQAVNGVGTRLSDANYVRVGLYYTILVEVTYVRGPEEFVRGIYTYERVLIRFYGVFTLLSISLYMKYMCVCMCICACVYVCLSVCTL